MKYVLISFDCDLNEIYLYDVYEDADEAMEMMEILAEDERYFASEQSDGVTVERCDWEVTVMDGGEPHMKFAVLEKHRNQRTYTC